MSLELDHVFVCCAPGAPEADALLRLGLLEGSRNTHPGQGTENRRFFFDNGYLELLWVSDPDEVRSPLTRRTRLWERWSQRTSGACPFGIAFRPAGSTVEDPPFDAWSYAPAYLPEGLAIRFAEATTLEEPELFYLAWPPRSRITVGQPTEHAVAYRGLAGVVVGVPDPGGLSAAARAVASAGLVSFKQSPEYVVELLFAGEVKLACDLRPGLPLVLKSASGAPNPGQCRPVRRQHMPP